MYSDEFQPGHRLGKYEILRELATGGMATIYLARTQGTGGFEKLVVLKCILPTLARDKGFLTNFLDEARLAATLRHANIAEVIDVGVEGTTYFFTMEYIHGQNARHIRIAAKQQSLPIPLEVSLAIISGTAAALGYAHDRRGPNGPLDLVHRDVSPSNVLVGYEGAVKLVDFGIARATMRRGAKTRTGMRKGKAPYMSPEQCRGKSVDRRSDLFSLGTMLYELTTGGRPFQGSSDFEVMDAIAHGKMVRPSQVVRDYPQRLERIVMTLLAASPQARYQSAGALLEDLEALIAERGMRTSAHVITKYLTELFGDVVTAPFELADTNLTVEYPDGEPPKNLLGTAADEEETLAFNRSEHLDLFNLRRPTTSSPFGGEEKTHLDPVLPFDPIDARSVEILSQLDADAPADETAQARALRRIDSLMQHALAWLGAGEADRAVTAVELALEEDLDAPATQEALQGHIGTIVQAYEGLLDDPYRVPSVTRPLTEREGESLDPRARDLLPQIDGQATILDILDQSGMQRLEAYHHLCQLLLRGIIT